MKESEIRPSEIFDEYLSYCKEDIKKIFQNRNNYVNVNCPACDSNKIIESFVKDSFKYNFCKTCKTLYVNPLPPQENFRKYYTEGKSVKFWATDFYKHTEKSRKEKIFKPRVKLIKKIFREEIKDNVDVLIDIGAGYGSFCEVAKNSGFFKEVIAIEPSPPFIEKLKEKKFIVINKFMEDVQKSDFKDFCNYTKLFCTFELWEHIYNPGNFLQSIKNVMNKGDYLIITTLNILGFDLLMLWEKSKSISPPHHISLFNLDSIQQILRNKGFEIKKAFTPGELDIDIVRNMNIRFDNRLCNYIANESDETFRKRLQEFITQNNMSSHMMIIAKL